MLTFYIMKLQRKEKIARLVGEFSAGMAQLLATLVQSLTEVDEPCVSPSLSTLVKDPVSAESVRHVNAHQAEGRSEPADPEFVVAPNEVSTYT